MTFLTLVSRESAFAPPMTRFTNKINDHTAVGSECYGLTMTVGEPGKSMNSVRTNAGYLASKTPVLHNMRTIAHARYARPRT